MVPFLFVGVYWLLFVMDEPLSETASIGVVILLGIVVNNAIVLVDCCNRMRQRAAGRFFVLLHALKTTGWSHPQVGAELCQECVDRRARFRWR